MLTDEQITILTNVFVKTGMRVGFENGKGANIALFRWDDSWELRLLPNRDPMLKDAQARFKFPDNLPDDKIDAAIALAGFITHKLHNWNTAKKSAASRPEGYYSKTGIARAKKHGQKIHKK